MRLNIPTDLLRSFVAIVDTGSMVRASERVFLSQSALSLQMKRLAELLQQPLFRRHQGTLELTPGGQTLLLQAREILAINDQIVASFGAGILEPVRIGMVQDFADAILSRVLARFKRSNPDVRLELRVGASAELREAIGSDLADIALYLSAEDGADTVAMAQLAWYGHEELLEGSSLPVAIMSRPCFFRDASLASLDAAGICYNVALETPSISVLRAAVGSGLCVTCRTSAFMGHAAPALPIPAEDLPRVAYNLGVRNGHRPIIESLVELIRAEIVAL